jgi:hypothetical protein
MRIISPKRLMESVFPTVRNGGIFNTSSLDLQFARTKTLDSRVTFTRASSGTYVGSDGLIKTATTNEPRFDHNPTTGESLGLLVEEQRTNSVRNNTMVGAVAGTPGTNPTNWGYVTTQSNGLTQTIVGTGTENGINYIDYRFNGTTVASPNAIAFGIEGLAGTAATGQTWTASIFLRLVSGTLTGVNNTQIGLIENTSGGGFVGGALYTVSPPTSAALIRQRATATRTLSGGATVGICALTLNINVAGSTAIDFTLRIGMPQLEQGAFATSVIPTTSATVTRSADVASITGANFSSWYRQDEGSFYADVLYGSKTTSLRLFFAQQNATGFTNRNGLLGANGGGTIGPYAEVAVSGTVQAQLSSGAPAANARYLTAYAYKANDFAFSRNGSAVAVDTAGSVPTVDEAWIGQEPGVNYFNGTIRRLTYWPTRLSNSTLQEITR